MASLPEPKPGLVIGYAYLWRDEALRGREEGVKDRPCVVLLAVRRQGDTIIVTVAPVTHTPPGNPRLALEIPAGTKQRLGLDERPSWIVLHDLNQFVWPGNDLRTIRRGSGAFAYGILPANLYKVLRDRIVALFREGAIGVTRRQP